jgi:hypothetical protein
LEDDGEEEGESEDGEKEQGEEEVRAAMRTLVADIQSSVVAS